MWRTFWEVFIPLFVAIDPLGLIPIFLAVTHGMAEPQRRRTSLQAVSAALLIAAVFMFLGQAIFHFLGITENDFRIAGGVLLLVLAVLDLLSHGKPAVEESDIVGIVPLAMPLIAGPATLTTVLVLASRPKYGYAWTTASLAVNFAVLLVVLLSATRIAKIVGANTLRAFSKLVMVLLAAIAVNFIRTGITNVLRH
jgi:multiple antibiotic resistance protein